MEKRTTSKVTETRSRWFLRWCSNLCLAAGMVALLYFGFVWTEAHFFQAYAQWHFDSDVKATAVRLQKESQNPVPSKLEKVSTSFNEKDAPIAKLIIGRLGMSVMVLEGDDDGTLRLAAGHIPDTAFPGHAGNVGIAAHRDTFFRPLEHIRSNDQITLETTTGDYQYQVDATWVVAPERVDVLDPTPKPALTLVTCYPFHFIGSAPYRFIVRAHQISSSHGAVAAPGASDYPGKLVSTFSAPIFDVGGHR